MKSIFISYIFIITCMYGFSQEVELTKQEKQKIIDEINCCTGDFNFLMNSKECVSLVNLSFNSERLSYNPPWCNSIIACLDAINQSKDKLLTYNFNWELKEITPLDLEHCKLCGVFNYNMITNLGCYYYGRNCITCNMVKVEDKWIVDNLAELINEEVNE